MPRDDYDSASGSSPLAATVSLLREAQRGDRRALESLFARYLPRVRQIVAVRLGQGLRQVLDVEDLVQEAMLRALSGIERFEQRSEGGFRNWLARCVENSIIDARRAATAAKRGAGKVRRLGDFPSVSLSESVIAAHGPTPSALLRGAELESRLERALVVLPSHHRELIVLRQLCDMSYEEVAEALGFEKAETARRACNRALEKLRKLLESRGSDSR